MQTINMSKDGSEPYKDTIDNINTKSELKMKSMSYSAQHVKSRMLDGPVVARQMMEIDRNLTNVCSFQSIDQNATIDMPETPKAIQTRSPDQLEQKKERIAALLIESVRNSQSGQPTLKVKLIRNSSNTTFRSNAFNKPTYRSNMSQSNKKYDLTRLPSRDSISCKDLRIRKSSVYLKDVGKEKEAVINLGNIKVI